MSHSLPSREFDRQFRVLDQTLSGHAMLRDRYERRSFLLVASILALSIAATSAAFLAGEAYVVLLGVGMHLQTWLGMLTAGIFFLTLLDLLTDWRQRAGAHAEAARRLGELKGLYRAAVVQGDAVTSEMDLRYEYDRVMGLVPPIPEELVLGLKAKHVRKVEMSRLIDTHPGAPLLYLRFLTIVRGIRGRSKQS